MTHHIFGSSLHKESGQWQVWKCSLEGGLVILLSAYRSQLIAETTAFDLAHGAARMYDAKSMESIAGPGDSDLIALSTLEQWTLQELIRDALTGTTVPEKGKVEIAVRRTDLDQIFVVTFPSDFTNSAMKIMEHPEVTFP